MPSWRAVYDTQAEANQACADTESRLVAEYTAATEATGQAVGPCPVVRFQYLSIDRLPPGAIPGSVPYARVVVMMTGPDGCKAKGNKICRLADINPSTGGSGYLKATTLATLTAKSSVAQSTQIANLPALGSVAANAVLRATNGKLYKTASLITLTSGSAGLAGIVEVDSSDPREVTLGTSLQFVDATYAGAICNVDGMAHATGAIGSTLIDRATGLTYELATTLDLPLTVGLSGDITASCSFTGDNPGPNAVAVGTVLEFNPPLPGIATKCTVTTSPTVGVPANLALLDTAASVTLYTATDVVIGDAGKALVAFVPDPSVSDYHLALPHAALSVVTPPTGVASTVDIVSAPGGLVLPFDAPSQVVGGPVTFSSYVRQEPGGKWSANVFTEPMGT